MKEKPLIVKLGRKQVAPRNLAAKSLGDGQFKPRVETDPGAYRRKQKHKVDPVLKAEEQDGQ
jgi:stalled ribosome alternative rescue factor ArfA